MNDISSFMHELKNSLNNIYLAAQIIEQENNIETIKKYSSIVKHSITHIKNIEHDFDAFTKTGLSKIELNSVYVNDIIIELLKEYKHIAEDGNVVLNYKCIGEPKYINTDVTKLKQVLSNLISNAIKYSNKNSCIEITYDCLCNEIDVCDQGIGMTLAELKCIGKPFYRCKRKDTTGSGLGLSVVKKIVKLMSWKISIESKLNSGTKFTLCLS
jgi:signal transduction histidine kinase